MGRTSDAKDRIIASGMQLFHERSAADVGVQEICEHAGVKKGSFYHFFDSKQDLILAALDTHWEMAKRQVWDPAFDSALPPLQRIEEFMTSSYEHARDMQQNTGQFSGCGLGNLAAELSTQDEVVRQRIEAMFMEAVSRIKRALDEAVSQGDLPKDLDTMEVAKALWAYFEGAILLAKCKQDAEVLKDLTQTAKHLLERLGAAVPSS